MVRRVLAVVLVASIAGCAADASPDDPTTDDSSEVKVDTSTPLARKQYDANVAFAMGYAPRCTPSADPSRPRVLVTGFGRFMSTVSNATGHVVATLLDMPYPDTTPPPPDQIDPPEPQLAVKTATLDVPGVGPVDVCGMVLPVYWDLAAILIAKEAQAFDPSFVLMNGVAGWRQPLWLELGSLNRADANEDGSNILVPALDRGKSYATLVASAPASETARPNLLSWRAVQSAARATIEAHADATAGGSRFGDVLEGAVFAGFPRTSNTYLCNNVTYVTGYLMSHPDQSASLLRASQRKRGAINEVKVQIGRDLSEVPRVFVHWPSMMADAFHAEGAEVMKSMIAAQIAALRSGDRPTLGDNALADPSLPGGDTY